MNVAAVDAVPNLPIFRVRPSTWIIAAIALLAGYFAFETGVRFSASWIMGRPEYSHGVLIPFIAAFLVWQRREALERLPFDGSWTGFVLLAFGVALNLMGKLSALFIIQQYSVVLAFYGLVMAMVGTAVFRRIWVPMLLLLFMIPLPEFLLQGMSAKLQLVSSQIGVWVIRLFGISVFLEGNVIDLGVYKLQVAEACDGLRYLFPLMTLGFMVASFYRAPTWKRVLVFVSSIPITILMNSFRIGVIGVTVEHWGIGMAEGFLHEFQGWAVFMFSAALMLALMAGLSAIGRDRQPWRDAFGLEFPAARPRDAIVRQRPVPASFVAASAMLVAAAVAVQLVPERVEDIPARAGFVDFADRLGGWNGRKEPLERVYRDALKLDDYLMANYSDGAGHVANLYVAWYDTQRAGRSTHSPRTCLPGGGWAMEEFSQVDLPGIAFEGRPLRVNRAIIRLGDSRQLVYYFFKQRHRIVTNEYLVKWYLFWDSVTRNRTDGALVRLIMPVPPGDTLQAAEQRLTGFAALAIPRLAAHVPD
jgi:exosortase D (VPLPA-CTERM-specific)